MIDALCIAVAFWLGGPVVGLLTIIVILLLHSQRPQPLPLPPLPCSYSFEDADYGPSWAEADDAAADAADCSQRL